MLYCQDLIRTVRTRCRVFAKAWCIWPRSNVHCDKMVLGVQDIKRGARSQPPDGVADSTVQKTYKQAVMGTLTA